MRLVVGTSILFISVVFLNSIQLSSQSEEKKYIRNNTYNKEIRPPIFKVQDPKHADFRNIRPSAVPNDIAQFRGNIPPEAAEFLKSRALPVPYGQFHRNVNNPLNENAHAGTSGQYLQNVNPIKNDTSPNEDDSQTKHLHPN